VIIGYLYWDPNPEMLPIDLPLLHRGVLWYGFLFALGFFVGYWVFLYLIRRYFLFFPQFRKEDIASFSELIRQLKTAPELRSVKAHVSAWKAGEPISEEMKIGILKSLNAFLLQAPSPIKKRLELEERFSCFLSLKKRAMMLTEAVTLYVVIGAVVGARLGDVLFYQSWSEIVHHPLAIFKVWEGGLASHGAAIGILLALALLSKRKKVPFLVLLDLLVIPTALAGMFIRIGNFLNQEILGVPTTLPWGIVFGHPVGVPAGENPLLPRHPVQLYEAFWYGLVFLFLLRCFRRDPELKKAGLITGFFLVLVFGFRFCIEFLKEEQSRLLEGHSFLTMGQWLSIPIIALGFYFLFRSRKSYTI
jgi:phosphatidylglycerol---prolipoprotein diacylglyceryl transferase